MSECICLLMWVFVDQVAYGGVNVTPGVVLTPTQVMFIPNTEVNICDGIM